MRIIRLGNTTLRFLCPECGTEFEIETDELYQEGENVWSYPCPLCLHKLEVKNDGVLNFLHNRNKLSIISHSHSIDELDLSVRAYNCLRRAGLDTIEEVTSKTEDQLKQIRNMGKKTIREIKEKLAYNGLSLAQK